MKYAGMGSQLWLDPWNKSLKLTQFSPLPLEVGTVGSSILAHVRDHSVNAHAMPWILKTETELASWDLVFVFRGSFLAKGTWRMAHMALGGPWL